MQKAGKIDNKVLTTGMIIVGIVVVALIIANSFGSTSYENTVSANGQATIKALPDFVSVYFNVQTTGTTADSASDKNTEIVNKAKENLIALGFSEDDIKTQSYSVYPNYDWNSGTQRITGYTATHALIVQISLDEKEKIGSAIDAGINAGAGINYINYELTQENQNQYKAEAIRAATEDARTKAEALASGAGKELGKVVSISTNDYGYAPWMAYASADSGSGTEQAKSGAEIATTITPSEQEITASVTAVFRLR